MAECASLVSLQFDSRLRLDALGKRVLDERHVGHGVGCVDQLRRRAASGNHHMLRGGACAQVGQHRLHVKVVILQSDVQFVQQHQADGRIAQQFTGAGPCGLGFFHVARAVLRLPRVAFAHYVKAALFGKATQEAFFAGRDRALDELHHADLHVVAHGADHHAEAGAGFALAVTGVDEQHAAPSLLSSVVIGVICNQGRVAAVGHLGNGGAQHARAVLGREHIGRDASVGVSRAVHQQGVRGEAARKVQVMHGQHDQPAVLAAAFAQQAQHGDLLMQIEVGDRFIEQQHARLLRHHGSHGDTLTFTAGKGAHIALGKRLQLQCRHRCIHGAGIGVAFPLPARQVRMAAGHHGVVHSDRERVMQGLRQKRAAAGHRQCRPIGERHTVERDAAAVWRTQPCEHGEPCRLACAVRADHAPELPGGGRHRQPLDQHAPIDRHSQIAQRQFGRCVQLRECIRSGTWTAPPAHRALRISK
ncbi:hypothetical protein COLO4_01515 [Corchorus olitorius]|uniref:Uncharacterized protein n=1 Tax=Corchorus olitorius TaxID=93759 RepID=A0A1R3L2E7_9ROSI|nr:hypothetical protein COLO4_01515 [Corchorus olitorius]